MTDALRWMPIRPCLRVMRRALWVLLTALVLVQTMGVLHRAAHATGTSHVHASVGTYEKSNVLSRLWGEHSSLADCQLFDQACPDALHQALLSTVTVTASHVWQVATLQERFSPFERFYAARGPPAFA